ncbi:LAFE_0H12046g1_1 [Lachancea fermentati]|uniref:LAFE_0H12046g1_1 n=1 Tax=Lachancea fermentati TaxID=4955 RepID=A0A1G4MKM0_LACFM|nr:LAFE_0H12046g1_1 [Lachancea fermentati]
MLTVTKNYSMSWARLAPRARYITYLHSGSRVRGIKRDPAEYLRLPSGLSYTDLQPQSYHDRVRSELNLSSHGIELSNEIIVQCLTHKSFAHGSKPYNEKLAALGAQFLKYHASVHSLKSQDADVAKGNASVRININGLNFTNLGTQFSKQLIAKQTTAKFIKARQLDSLVFWKRRDPLKNDVYNGESSVLSSVLNAIVGGILTTNGPQKAAAFIEKELLNCEKEVSLINIANTSN